MDDKRFRVSYLNNPTADKYAKDVAELRAKLAQTKDLFLRPNYSLYYAGCPSMKTDKQNKLFYVVIDVRVPKKELIAGASCWSLHTDGLYYMATIQELINGTARVVYVNDVHTEVYRKLDELKPRDFDAFALLISYTAKSYITIIERNQNWTSFKHSHFDIENAFADFALPLLPYKCNSHSINENLMVLLHKHFYEDTAYTNQLPLKDMDSNTIKLNNEETFAILKVYDYLLHWTWEREEQQQDRIDYGVGKGECITLELFESNNKIMLQNNSRNSGIGKQLFDSIDDLKKYLKKSDTTAAKLNNVSAPQVSFKTTQGRHRDNTKQIFLRPIEYLDKNYCVICKDRMNLPWSSYSKHLTEDCYHFRRCPICHQATHDQDHCPQKDFAKKCHWCGQEGHFKANCPNAQSCYHCEGIGHGHKQCPLWRLKPKEAKAQIKEGVMAPYIRSRQEEAEYQTIKRERMEHYHKKKLDRTQDEKDDSMDRD